MNGGILHAVECVTGQDLSDAAAGYRYFGFEAVSSLLSRAKAILDAGQDLETHELQLDRQYAVLIPSDSYLGERFETHLQENPSEYAPIIESD
jgi:hypothetical protein